jgi:uncharacterized protein YjbI with pentapeptide repeats
MSELGPGLEGKQPINILKKPLQADFRGLFKALSKGISHAAMGKWGEIASDTVEALSAIGLTTEPGELAFLLIRRSLTRALFNLVGESAIPQLAAFENESDALIQRLDSSIPNLEIRIDSSFLDRPADLSLIGDVQTILQKWLEELELTEVAAKAIVDRLPSYFVYELNQEWRQNAKSYRPLIEALNTPFVKAGEREWAWAAYSSFLERRVQEGVFDEPFGLSQIYVPLNAYFFEERPHEGDSDGTTHIRRRYRRVVVSLHDELEKWLQETNPQAAIRVISGGPGSGKSSFARMFASSISRRGNLKRLFVPLHLIDPTKDLIDEVGRFVRDEGILLQNPLDPEHPEPNLVIIFDGLDELASQGKAAAETARAFVREVERAVERRNHQTVRLRVLISGRELVVQENESEFRRPRQILTLLPYYSSPPLSHDQNVSRDCDQYHDPNRLLRTDLRQQWWKNYGVLSGKGYEGLPRELDREDLSEITAQPLLNYLVALSLTRGKLDFSRDINLNSIYSDLVAAVYERGYEKHRSYVPIRHMKVEDFSRMLEEIGLAAWHGDGRTTTVREIEEHCCSSGLSGLLDVFKEGAKAGVTRLLAAFFFRQYGHRASGDPTFVFTHKSFGEYLTARRVVRAIDRIVSELVSRAENPDKGWDNRDALNHWCQICGPSAISQYLHIFLINEIKLRPQEKVIQWQKHLISLFNQILKHGLPMEKIQFTPFNQALFHSRNSEEALLVALNACARITTIRSVIDRTDPTLFSAWLRRIQGQRKGYESALAVRCLDYIDLSGAICNVVDLLGSNLSNSNLDGTNFHFSCLYTANLYKSTLERANLQESNLKGANLQRANLQGANLEGANLKEANLKEANLKEANLERANLQQTNLQGVRLERAKLKRGNLKGSNLLGANLEEANLERASFLGANLLGANLLGANLQGASFLGANLEAVMGLSTDDRLACVLPETGF